MPLIARDSTDPQAIPLDGLSAVMGYADGAFQWTSAGWARFGPAIVPLSIVVSAANRGDILDVETGDATPADCPGWADAFSRPGRRRPTIYHSRELRGPVLAAMAGRPYDWWAATLDGTLDGTDGAVAVQWKGSAQTGGDYDETVILDPAWVGARVMAVIVQGDNTSVDPHGLGAQYLAADPVFGPKRYVPDPVTLAAYVSVVGPAQTLPQLVVDRMEELTPVASGSYAVGDASTIQASVATLLQLVTNLGSGVPDPAVKAELDALSRHLGVGVA